MAKYPVLFAGQRFTASLAGSMEADFYLKTTATARASTTTATDDPDLQVPVVVGEVSLIEFYVKYASSTSATALLKTQWGFPAGTTGNRQVGGAGSGATDGSADNMASHWGVHGSGTAEVYGARGTSGQQLWLYEWAVVTVGATAGNVTFQWAQNVSNAASTSVVNGSLARRTRFA